MNSIQEGQDECSLSGSSFHTLNMIHSQEAGEITPSHDVTTSDNDINGINPNNNDGGMNHTIQNFSNDHHDDESDDGYPTDERTIHSFTRPKEKELKRQTILQLARNRLAKKKPPKDFSNDSPEQAADDSSTDSSFLAGVDVADVENTPDDSSFLVNADVDNAPDEFESVGNMGENNDADSNYDVYASTLSRASASTRASTIGDQILKDSYMAAQMTRNGNPGADDQSASTYSYRRAYIDNATLGSNSNFTSTCSALTDDYTFHARRTGMSEAIKTNAPHHNTFHGDIKRTVSGPVDADTGAMIPPSDKSHEESLARPPSPRLSNHSAYENPEHLARIVSYGEGEGYVDEEAARKFANSDEEKNGCCGWFTSSSRMVKIVVMFSILLMFLSVASLALAYLLPQEKNVGTDSSARSSVVANNGDEKIQGGIDIIEDVSRQNDVGTLVPTGSPTPPAPSSAHSTVAPSALADTRSCDVGLSCFEDGSRCTDGTTESCCGETFDSFVCDCANVDGNLKYMCFFTDACLIQSCETFATPTPSKAPESIIYTTSAITGSPTKQPFMAPTLVPSKRPTQLPTEKPSNQPTAIPSKAPTDQPTTERPTPLPTELPITTKVPTSAPTLPPSSNAPTPAQALTPIPTELPITTKVPTSETTLPPSSNAPTPAQALTQTVTLQATKDTYTNSTSPETNYGTSRRIRVDGSPRVWSFIAFDTTSVIKNTARTQRQGQPAHQNEPRKLHGVQVLQAKLRLYALDEGGGGIFFALPNARQWEETDLTWNDRSEVGRSGEFRVGSISWVDAFNWYEIDVTDAFTNNESSDAVGTFLIKSDSTNGVAFASRERNSGSYSPELVLTFTTGTDISTNPPISASPTPAPASRPTHFPTRPASPTPAPESPWPTYSPTRPDPTNSPTPRSSRPPSMEESVARPSMSPSNYQTSPTGPNFVPPGCPVTADINLAFKEALMPGQSTPGIIVLFPSQDSHVGGGIYSDENYGSAGTLVLDSSTSKVLIEFDLGLIALTNSIYNVVSVSLRLFVNSVGDSTRSISISRLPHSIGWDEQQVTWENFGAPPLPNDGPTTFQVTSSDGDMWIDVDITDIIDGSQANKFVLSMKDISASGEAGKCVFASRETCHSSKLVVVTESI
eukprot:CAMPEP_0201945280 /NCGR_PEP_ID=MMETSP0903-20130614/53821_1 /ASSEMBLY_ACC=CAM_ASM_000552 /TAXON_ID=420261 /ORGANISM="Thalassiosira antarctica, Strain CCMP982" /LENGTH=1137 /DNA_ID=CAMNT_0048488343 /DNA_START=75 /DNA_END=3488 /DNA_ORIENTATION=-